MNLSGVLGDYETAVYWPGTRERRELHGEHDYTAQCYQDNGCELSPKCTDCLIEITECPNWKPTGQAECNSKKNRMLRR